MDGRLAVDQPLDVTVVGLPPLGGKGIEQTLDLGRILRMRRQLAGKFDPAMLAS